jgi:hypothetical protein
MAKKSSKRPVRKTASARKTRTTSGPRKSAKRRKAAKRTLVAPKGDKRFVRRSAGGRFSESDDVGMASAADRRRKAKRKAPRGHGDKGDR